MYLETTEKVEFMWGMFSPMKDYLFLKIDGYSSDFSSYIIDFHYEIKKLEMVEQSLPGADEELEPIEMEVFHRVPRSEDKVRISIQETDVLYSQIKTLIPSGIPDSEHQKYKMYLGAKMMMFNAIINNPNNSGFTLDKIEIKQ